MTPREIIAKAWAITTKERQLRKWGFASSVLETMLNAKLFVYQAWFLYSYLQGDPIGFFTVEATVMKYVPMPVFVGLMVLLGILVCIEWIFPHFAKGAIIGLGAKAYRKEERKGGLVLGFYNFFPIFGVHELLTLSSLSTIVTLSSLSLRYGAAAGKIGVLLLIGAWLFFNFLHFIWIFAEEGIVIRKEGVRKALRRSFKLVISYLGHVMFLILLMFVIFLRVLANAFMVILVPAVIMGLGFLLTSVLPHVISYGIAAAVGLLIIFIAGYFFAYIEVFRQMVWTITYIELSKLKDLDLIEGSAE